MPTAWGVGVLQSVLHRRLVFDAKPCEAAHRLGGDPFIQLGRHGVVNLRAVEYVNRSGDRNYRVRLHDRLGSEIKASRTGAARLTAALALFERINPRF